MDDGRWMRWAIIIVVSVIGETKQNTEESRMEKQCMCRCVSDSDCQQWQCVCVSVC